MLAAVFFTICQTVFSEMPWPRAYQLYRHICIANHSRYRTPIATHRVSRSPNMGQLVRMRTYPAVDYHAVTAPNADTLYTTAWLDVSQEP
jgi:hypothetical protein